MELLEEPGARGVASQNAGRLFPRDLRYQRRLALRSMPKASKRFVEDAHPSTHVNSSKNQGQPDHPA